MITDEKHSKNYISTNESIYTYKTNKTKTEKIYKKCKI
jgi:hypothetical protein